MGMFDTIVIPSKGIPVKCPGCKHEYFEFQTKDLCNMMDCYTEGATRRKWFPIRAMTEAEKKEEAEKYPGLKGWSPSYTADTDNPRYTGHPTYMSAYAYTFCDGCSAMLGQVFRFDTKGLLKRYGKPKLEKS